MAGATTATPGTRSPVPFSSWWMVAVLFLFYVVAWIDRLIISMLVGPIKADLLLSDFQVSLIIGTAFALPIAIFGLPLGWAADRFSRRWVIFLGVAVWSLATVSCGFADSFTSLFFARAMVGVGEAALLPAAYSLMSDAFPRDRVTTATSIFQSSGKLGSAVAFGLGGVIIAFAASLGAVNLPFRGETAPWHLVFILRGAPGLLLSLLAFSFPEPARKNTVARTAGDKGGKNSQLLKQFVTGHWQLLALMITSFCAIAICGYSLGSWIPTYIDRRFGWEPIQYGPALSVMNIVAAGALIVNGRIVDFLYGRGMKDVHLRFYSWLLLGLMPAFAYMFFAGNPWVFLLLYAAVQLATMPFMVYMAAVLALIAPSTVRGQMMGVFLFFIQILGFGVGPAIVGFLTDNVFQDEAKLGLSLAAILIGGIVVAFLCLRMGLRYLRPAIERVEQAQASASTGS